MIYKLMQFKLLIPVILLKKLTIKQTFVELKRKYLIIMMIKILQLKNLITRWQIMLQRD